MVMNKRGQENGSTIGVTVKLVGIVVALVIIIIGVAYVYRNYVFPWINGIDSNDTTTKNYWRVGDSVDVESLNARDFYVEESEEIWIINFRGDYMTVDKNTNKVTEIANKDSYAKEKFTKASGSFSLKNNVIYWNNDLLDIGSDKQGYKLIEPNKINDTKNSLEVDDIGIMDETSNSYEFLEDVTIKNPDEIIYYIYKFSGGSDYKFLYIDGEVRNNVFHFFKIQIAPDYVYKNAFRHFLNNAKLQDGKIVR